MTEIQEVIDGARKWCVVTGDCLDVLPTLEAGCVDAVVTDPPYLTSDSRVPIRGNGVAERIEDSESVGLPWGYSNEWIDVVARLEPRQWAIFCNYRMLSGVVAAVEEFAILSCIFTWRKPNAPRMVRPVPRLDSEFIVWARHKMAGCARMKEFESMVIDEPSPAAGCFATERLLKPGSGKAAHPCQKPLSIVRPFVVRLDAHVVLDPFCGSGTTGVACLQTGRRFIGIEIDPAYAEIARRRIANAMPLFSSVVEPTPEASGLFDGLEAP